MQPQIQPTLAATGSDTQPTPGVQFVETEVPITAPVAVNKSGPFWSGVIMAGILVLIISAILAGIMFILPPTH
jgi:hypothetical protein